MSAFLKFVPHLLLLGFEVAGVLGFRRRFDRHLLHDFKPVAAEADDLARVVGHEADLPHAEVVDDLGTDAVIAQIHREAEFEVRFDGVETLLLELVGQDFAVQADAAPFVAAHVDDDAFAGFFDMLHRGVQLATAIAAA